MKETEFWAIVDQVDWATLSQGPKDCEIGKGRMLQLLPSLEKLEEFREHYDKKSTGLYILLDTWESDVEFGDRSREFGLGDDSFDDLIAHIIGLGQNEYAAVSLQPELALQRARKHQYVESFAYCIPNSSDYASVGDKLKKAEAALDYWVDKATYSEGAVAARDWQDVQDCVKDVAILLSESESISCKEAQRRILLQVQEKVVSSRKKMVVDRAAKLAEAEVALRAAEEQLKILKGE